MKKITKKLFLEIIKSIIGQKIQININNDIRKIKEWDSLNNIRIILKINKLFKKKIEIEEISDKFKISEIYNYINKK